MPTRVSADDVLERLSRPIHPPLVAIDGLPCAGKTTLAGRIQAALGFDCLYVDDFVRPERDWPSTPAFPFEFMRYDELLAAVRTLAATGECVYARFDFETSAMAPELRRITTARPVVVEGVSALHPELCPLYGLRVWVDGDRATVLEAAERRGAGTWLDHWRNLFLPSVDLYLKSRPERRADLVVAGRRAPRAGLD